MIDDVSRQVHANVKSFLFVDEKYETGALPFRRNCTFPSRYYGKRLHDSEVFTEDSTVMIAADNACEAERHNRVVFLHVYFFPRGISL